MRSACLGCVALVSLLCLSSSAMAAPCGTPKSPGEEPTFGTLTLKADQSEPNVNAGRTTSERQMVFVFDVSECRLPDGDEVGAKVRSSDLDAGATFGPPEVEAEKSRVVVPIPVKPDQIDPGQHT